MTNARLASLPIDHLLAEMAVFPLVSEAGLRLRITQLDPNMSENTENLWREAERQVLTCFPAFSVDEAVSIRDYFWFGWQDDHKIPLHDYLKWKDDAVQGVFIGVFAIALIYLLGLICHGIQRIVLWLIWFVYGKRNSPEPTAWFANLKKDNPRYELIMYFWYMRSTCWNLVVSIVLAAIICYPQHYKLALCLSELVIIRSFSKIFVVLSRRGSIKYPSCYKSRRRWHRY